MLEDGTEWREGRRCDQTLAAQTMLAMHSDTRSFELQCSLVDQLRVRARTQQVETLSVEPDEVVRGVLVDPVRSKGASGASSQTRLLYDQRRHLRG